MRRKLFYSKASGRHRRHIRLSGEEEEESFCLWRSQTDVLSHTLTQRCVAPDHFSKSPYFLMHSSLCSFPYPSRARYNINKNWIQQNDLKKYASFRLLSIDTNKILLSTPDFIILPSVSLGKQWERFSKMRWKCDAIFKWPNTWHPSKGLESKQAERGNFMLL